MTALRDQLGRHVFPVHRLDRATSGVLLFALSSEMAAKLQAEFEAGTVRKQYLALVRGTPPASCVVDHPVPKTEDGPRVPAVTEVRTLGTSGRFSLVLAEPRTGRLHQVRRHLKHLGHPLVGDVNYGRGEINRLFREQYGLHRLFLHAWTLALPHPRTGAPLAACAPVPAELQRVLEALELASALEKGAQP
jgi:tRNA pseudouridine65 synthase